MAKRKLSKWNMFVKKIFKEGRGKNSNFKFKDALKEASDRKEEMGNDSSHSSSSSSSSHKKMDKKYQDAGIRVHGKPYKPPHILFWNLRSSNGFPTLSSQPNASMMSGFSPSLLNMFCEKGLEALQSCTPWSILDKILDNERYKIMNDKLNQEITA
jgi:hypothetical protein